LTWNEPATVTGVADYAADNFYGATRMHSVDYDVEDVCLSVCLYVTRRY